MTQFTVIWKFDIRANNARQAAELAQEILRDDEYDWAFEVIDDVTGNMEYVDLDISEENQDD